MSLKLKTTPSDVSKLNRFTSSGLPTWLYARAKLHQQMHILVSEIDGEFYTYGLSETGGGISDIKMFLLRNVLGIRNDNLTKIIAASEKCPGFINRFQIPIETLRPLLPKFEDISIEPLFTITHRPEADVRDAISTTLHNKGTDKPPKNHKSGLRWNDPARIAAEKAEKAAAERRAQRNAENTSKIGPICANEGIPPSTDKLAEAFKAFGLRGNRNK
ncbi:MAG: hypothetical protein Q8P68_03390 [Candidatus Peregrinibacteria bacterium]|nr:hypothetical protein [Candidatus Peregrinibacteria bacterium]MDZ4244842.1 hypothetical protein [Candidatus Gracilibacteria bacterium]